MAHGKLPPDPSTFNCDYHEREKQARKFIDEVMEVPERIGEDETEVTARRQEKTNNSFRNK